VCLRDNKRHCQRWWLTASAISISHRCTVGPCIAGLTGTPGLFTAFDLLICLQRLTLETSNSVHGSAMWSLSLVMSECSLSGRGQGHVSNFYIVDLENFAIATRLYIGDIHNSVLSHVYDTYKTMEMTRSHHGWVHMFSTHRPTVILQLHHFDLFRTCRTSSFSTVVWQLARLQLTRRIARSLGDSGASCFIQVACLIINLLLLFM